MTWVKKVLKGEDDPIVANLRNDDFFPKKSTGHAAENDLEIENINQPIHILSDTITGPVKDSPCFLKLDYIKKTSQFSFKDNKGNTRLVRGQWFHYSKNLVRARVGGVDVNNCKVKQAGGNGVEFKLVFSDQTEIIVDTKEIDIDQNAGRRLATIQFAIGDFDKAHAGDEIIIRNGDGAYFMYFQD